MEGISSLVPITPPRTNMKVPTRCPRIIASNPVLNPSGAINPPVKISAIEIAAPHQRNAKCQKDNLFSLLFVIHPCLFI
jgi:hypothetical protein